MKTAVIRGIELAYRDEGTGSPLLLIHAFPLNSAMWEPQIAALSSQHRVIAPDLRGFGATTLGTRASSIDQYADDLAGLLDYLSLDQLAVAGLSMGGYISFALWWRHRARISDLILADTRATADNIEAKQGREQNARLAETQGSSAIADQMLSKLLSPHASTRLRDSVRQLITTNERAGIAAALRAMAARPDSTSLLESIDVPTLVIVGAEDALTPPSDANVLASAIAGSRLIQIPAAGHLANLEAPPAFNQAVIEFLAPKRSLWAGNFSGSGSKSGGSW